VTARACQAVLALALAAGAALAGPGAEKKLAEPHLADGRVPVELFGSDRDVRLLGALLAEDDALAREQAAIDLGRTRNPRALPHLRRALNDPEPKVRSAAASAAAEFPADLAGPIVLAALTDARGGDRDPVRSRAARRTVWSVLAAVRTLSLRSAGGRVGALLADDDPALQADALATLTHLGLPAEADSLRKLLASRSTFVRLRAVENAMLAPKARARVLAGELAKLAAGDVAAVRGSAVAALAKLGLPSADENIERARRDPNLLVRRGAVRALAHAGRADAIGEFLRDPSPAVRLAAIRAAGTLRCADCAASLFTLMCDAPYDDYFEAPYDRPPPPGDAHLAARAALQALATDEVARLAAARLARLAPDLIRREADRVQVKYYKGEYNWMLTPDDIRDWEGFWRSLRHAGAEPPDAAAPGPAWRTGRFAQLLPRAARKIAANRKLTEADKSAILDGVNAVLKRHDLFRLEDFGFTPIGSARKVPLVPGGQEIVDKLLWARKKPPPKKAIAADLHKGKLHKLNRLLLDASFPDHVRPGPVWRPLGILRRDAISCLALLGASKSLEGYDTLLRLLRDLPVDSSAMMAAAGAAARIGDPRAGKLLARAVRVCRDHGRADLIASANMQPTPHPYGDHPAGRIVQALADLRGPEAAADVLAVAAVQFQDRSLTAPSAAAARALPRILTAGNRQAGREFVLSAVRGEGYTATVRFEAAKAAARMKLREALPALREIRTEERRNRTMIHVAAWATQEITGRTPPLPDPKPRPGAWIIRGLREGG